jgi:hypothetical protein
MHSVAICAQVVIVLSIAFVWIVRYSSLDLSSLGAIPHGPATHGVVRSPWVHCTRDSSWHVEVRLTLVLWARGSPVTVPTLKPMQVARL